MTQTFPHYRVGPRKTSKREIKDLFPFLKPRERERLWCHLNENYFSYTGQEMTEIMRALAYQLTGWKPDEETKTAASGIAATKRSKTQ